MLLWTRSLPGQLTVTLHIQLRIVIKGGKMVTVVFGACVGHLQREDYNEESVKSLLAEKREAKELKENRETREFVERKLIRAFVLERMKLANSMDTISVSSTDFEGQGVNRRVNLRDLVPKFDAKKADINLFFEIFERQTGGEDDNLVIPAFEGEGEKSLAEVNGVKFKEEQRKCPDLKPLWDKAQTEIDKAFKIVSGKLVRVVRTKRGEEVPQLCVPIKFKLDIIKLSHDE
ncbi:hypothetical protein TNCV_4051871 [Trichonephila clavipes]|nr:hypothetical protein TNCV_4051871 [Trichonephila clavipes]